MNSEVEWIGDIPNNWSKQKLKYLFDEKKSTKNPSLQCGSISFGKVIYKDDDKVPISTKESYQELLEGEFLINPLNLNYDLKSLRIGKSEINVVVSQGYIILKLKGENIPEYFNYLLRDFDVKHMKSLGQGIRQTISYNHLKDEYLLTPPLSEQQQIVSFLDTKTSLIDSLIEKTQRKIELLKEKRTSLINEVVTKGLNPNVEMKDSGVEWIGKIPSHWETKKLKYLSEIIYGISPPDTTYNDEGVGTLLINGPVEYSKTDFGYTRSLKWTTEPNKFTSKGSLLFCLRGSTTGRMNITHTDVSIGRGVCSINSNENQWFLIYSMFSVRRWIQDQISGSTFPSVTSDDVNNYVICSPPIYEQQQIVEYLDKQTGIIDKTISIEEKRIELLKEYRQSLISEVVTGKRKVV
ncbi:restriction endonuclease subunit S [Flavobacteriaceae bacterium]|nr:restriction endonuclease subunit S [Flavobacteriaceae bacterium]